MFKINKSKETNMNRLKTTIDKLQAVYLIDNLNHFSCEWANRNKGWAAYTLHKKRDFNISTAINVLRNTRTKLGRLKQLSSKYGYEPKNLVLALTEIENLLENYLEEQHFITKVAD